jgi:hypothetical protein
VQIGIARNCPSFTTNVDFKDPSYGMAGELQFDVIELLQSNSKRHQAVTVTLEKRSRAKLRRNAIADGKWPAEKN